MYSVKATFLGMAIVFLFLSFLSLLMVLLKSVFEKSGANRKKNELPIEKGKIRQATNLPMIPYDSNGAADWLTAAAVLFLLEEQGSEQHFARGWKPLFNLSDERWIFTER